MIREPFGLDRVSHSAVLLLSSLAAPAVGGLIVTATVAPPTISIGESWLVWLLTEAVGILVRVHVDRALQGRIVGRRIAKRIVRPSPSRRRTGTLSAVGLTRFAPLRRAVRAHPERERQADRGCVHRQVSYAAG